MKHFAILTLTLLLSLYNTFSQTINGKIVSKEDNRSISYSNIGILGKSIGTISDTNGNFELIIKELKTKDTLRISAIGFETRDITINEIISKQLPINIFLEKKIYPIDEVVIKAKTTKARIVGTQTSSKVVQTGAKVNKGGVELASYLPVKKNAFLTNIRMNLASVPKDSVTFRIKIYSVEKKKPGELKSVKNILFRSKLLLGTNTFNVSDYQIMLSDDTFLSYELIEGKSPAFSVSLLGIKSYYRPASQANWEKLPGSIALYATLIYEK
ncbi:carboxypeptidase-like regulatory domain-containing protein [Sunxiuqinia rutila]|uniref:carboxypeptidase-like regulatory domain-containing protein n=1 Tax=Sunxiuqinia rutila TaxID=1397841 RepID=UPI003D36DE5A